MGEGAVRVAYTCGVRLGDGIGLTAEKGLDGLNSAGVLGAIHTREASTPPGDEAFDIQAAEVLKANPEWDTGVFWSHMALAQLQVARERGARSVVIRASTHPQHQRRVLAEEANRLGQGRIPSQESVERCEKEFGLADIVMVASTVSLATMVQHGVPREKLFLNPHGVDLDTFTPPENRTGPFRVAYTGPNVNRKGGVYLLKAMEHVPGAILEAPGLNCERVPDVAALYRRSHVYCLPTLEEGMALGVLEAAASGCAIVTTEASGATDILEPDKSCLIIPPRSSSHIASALQALRDDEGMRESLGREARKAVEAYPWSRHGAGVVKACEAAHR